MEVSRSGGFRKEPYQPGVRGSGWQTNPRKWRDLLHFVVRGKKKQFKRCGPSLSEATQRITTSASCFVLDTRNGFQASFQRRPQRVHLISQRVILPILLAYEPPPKSVENS